MNNYEEVLKELSMESKHSKELLSILESELALPNIPTPTMGGEVFWNTIAEYNGYKLQQNMFTHHARILNNNNVRIAWGTFNGMERAMDRLVQGLNKYKKDESTSNQRIDAMYELKNLKELLDIGAITQAEFEEKKSKIMKRI